MEGVIRKKGGGVVLHVCKVSPQGTSHELCGDKTAIRAPVSCSSRITDKVKGGLGRF